MFFLLLVICNQMQSTFHHQQPAYINYFRNSKREPSDKLEHFRHGYKQKSLDTKTKKMENSKKYKIKNVTIHSYYFYIEYRGDRIRKKTWDLSSNPSVSEYVCVPFIHASKIWKVGLTHVCFLQKN